MSFSFCMQREPNASTNVEVKERLSFVALGCLLAVYLVIFSYEQNPLAAWPFGFDQLTPTLQKARVEIEFNL